MKFIISAVSMFYLYLIALLTQRSLAVQREPRVSATMCENYKDLTSLTTTKYLGPLWDIDPDYYVTTKTYNCNAVVGLIAGGMHTKSGEYPHMAALGWNISEGKVQFECGGSLIAKNFVLTAAHCVPLGKFPSIIRLGVKNLDEAEPADYRIKRVIRHENYNQTFKNNDIALIELATDVTFTKFIRPACLQQNTRFNRTVVATGWGHTGYSKEASKELLKVSLNVSSIDVCNMTHYEGDLYASQICAGGVIGQDTCEGDSGGPIQVSHDDATCVYNIVGLTSFGSFYCGSRKPSIYTRISTYLDWIEKIVWPQLWDENQF